MAEGLGRIIKNALQTQQLRGISIHDSLAITHQQFVDDNILFGHPLVQEALIFKSLLNEYSEAFGASINIEKSQIFFFHTPPSIQSSITRILKFSKASLPSKYLGTPLTDSALKHSSWHLLLEKLEARLSSWTFRALNMASWLVLVKAILQSMPLYLFSVLAAPKWVLKRIKNLQCNFLKGSSSQNSKWALVKWTTVCLPKKYGGAALRDSQNSNDVMGASIWWKWLSAPNTPWATLWTTKYENNRPPENLIRLLPTEKGSLIWNVARQHRDMIQKHSFWEIRDGSNACFWVDSWQQRPRLSNFFKPPHTDDWASQQKEKVKQH